MRDNVKQFCKLVFDVAENKESDFNGLGMILYRNFEDLPVCPLNISNSEIILPVNNYNNILKILLELSTANHPNHDGFHLLSETMTLTHISQYFCTPIISTAKIEYGFGSRYMAALFGSYLSNVFATGIISNNYGPFIFIKGNKITPDDVAIL